MRNIMRKLCVVLMALTMIVSLAACASGVGEVTEPSGAGETTAPTEAVMQNSGGGSKATEPDETEAPTVENAGGTSEPDSPSESNSTEATTGKSAELTAGSTNSGNTGNTSSGNTGSTSSGNTGNTSSGNTSNTSSGNTGSTSSGNTGNTSSGNTGSTSSGNTSSTSSGNTGSTSTGNTSSTSPSTPAATTPKPTEPPATQPAPTEPAPTSPPEHVHDYSYSTNTVLASCTEPGYTLHICSCGASYRDEEMPALGYHNWSSWYITTQPTTQAEGQKERRCMTCGITETGTVPKLEQEWDGIDTAELERYGRQYAAETYGYDPVIGIRAGYYPGWTGKLTTMADGFLRVAGNIDATTRNLIASGGIDGASLDVEVIDEGDGYYTIWVYYG